MGCMTDASGAMGEVPAQRAVQVLDSMVGVRSCNPASFGAGLGEKCWDAASGGVEGLGRLDR